jgi:hypothetical protein
VTHNASALRAGGYDQERIEDSAYDVWPDEELSAEMFEFWRMREDLTPEQRVDLERAKCFFVAPQRPESPVLEGSMKHGRTVQRVRVSAILQKGAIILALLCVLSLVGLIWKDVPLMNPFLSMLLLTAAPFFYAMGARMHAAEDSVPEKNGMEWSNDGRVSHSTT